MTAQFVASGPGTVIVLLTAVTASREGGKFRGPKSSARAAAGKKRFKRIRKKVVVKKAGKVKVRLGRVPRGKYKLTAVLKANGQTSPRAKKIIRVR
jgi:hypothetical protein